MGNGGSVGLSPAEDLRLFSLPYPSAMRGFGDGLEGERDSNWRTDGGGGRVGGEAENIHFGVCCDGCGVCPVVWRRMKCGVCEN